MLVSVGKCVKCIGPMSIMTSFCIATKERERLAGYLACAIQDGNEEQAQARRESVAFMDKQIEMHVARFKATMKMYLEENKYMYIDSDGIMWTSPPHMVC